LALLHALEEGEAL
jgi:hypothetical protein